MEAELATIIETELNHLREMLNSVASDWGDVIGKRRYSAAAMELRTSLKKLTRKHLNSGHDLTANAAPELLALCRAATNHFASELMIAYGDIRSHRATLDDCDRCLKYLSENNTAVNDPDFLANYESALMPLQNKLYRYADCAIRKMKRRQKDNHQLSVANHGGSSEQTDLIEQYIQAEIDALLNQPGTVESELGKSKYDPEKGSGMTRWLGTRIGNRVCTALNKKIRKGELSLGESLREDFSCSPCHRQAPPSCETNFYEGLAEQKDKKNMALLRLKYCFGALNAYDYVELDKFCTSGYEDRIEKLLTEIREKTTACRKAWNTTARHITAKEVEILALSNDLARLRIELGAYCDSDAYIKNLQRQLNKTRDEIKELNRMKEDKVMRLREHDANLANKEHPTDKKINYIVGDTIERLSEKRTRFMEKLRKKGHPGNWFQEYVDRTVLNCEDKNE